MVPKDIWHIKGGTDNDLTIVVLGGVHGDELTGIEVIKKLKQLFEVTDKPSGTHPNDRVIGNIFFGFGNPQAIEQNTRAAGSKLDLNRMFNPEKLEAAPSEDDQPDFIRARELEPLLKQADYLIDIHSTSSPSIPFIVTSEADLDKLQELSKYLSAKYILIDPKSIYASYLDLPSSYSSDDYVNKLGKQGALGLCYETGYRKDITLVNQVYKEIISIFKEVGVVADDFLTDRQEYLIKGENQQKIYFLDEIIIAEEDGFTFAPGMDQGWREVVKGQEVGTYTSGKKEIIQKAGMNVFPRGWSIKKGHSLYYIAQPL